MTRRYLIALALLLPAGCATVPAPALRDDSPQEAIAAWARVLDRHVDERGRVDFIGIGKDRADLDRFVAWVAVHGPASDPGLFPRREEALAHHLNAYNALAMYAVIDAAMPQSLERYGLVRFFLLTRLRIEGRHESLYAYEKRIRALGDPRVHFALNCMAAGCPRLPRAPFRAGTLDADLDRVTREFLSERRNLHVDHERRTVRLSEIFHFFTEDFLAASPSLIAYVNRHVDGRIPDSYSVEFIPYDWTVAVQPPRR